MHRLRDNQSASASAGRIRRKLYRVHSVAPKVLKDTSESEEFFFPQITEPVNSNIFQNVGAESIKSSIFKNVVILPEALQQKLPSYSKKDKTNLEINQAIKKSNAKDTRVPKRRKIPFHEVVSSAKEFLNKREKEKKKTKETILTDFNALAEALPTLDLLMDKKIKDNAKPRRAKSFSKQDAEMMEDIQTYQQVLKDAQYAADPIGTITAQLKQRLESDCL